MHEFGRAGPDARPAADADVDIARQPPPGPAVLLTALANHGLALRQLLDTHLRELETGPR